MDLKNVSYNTNADSYPLYKQNYSCQLVPMLFFNNGSDLYNYEMLFNNCGGGIVPLSLILYAPDIRSIFAYKFFEWEKKKINMAE